MTSCPDAIASAEAALTSYHYTKACQDKYNLPSLPPSVAAAKVIDCFVAPAPGWSYGTVVAVEVCCNVEPQGFPCDPSQWTNWLDRDNPGGTGDYEDLATHYLQGSVCPEPCGIECQTLSGAPASSTG